MGASAEVDRPFTRPPANTGLWMTLEQRCELHKAFKDCLRCLRRLVKEMTSQGTIGRTRDGTGRDLLEAIIWSIERRSQGDRIDGNQSRRSANLLGDGSMFVGYGRKVHGKADLVRFT